MEKVTDMQGAGDPLITHHCPHLPHEQNHSFAYDSKTPRKQLQHLGASVT